jgi:hypothetical protein
MAAPGFASAQPESQKVALYANVGTDLTHYYVDVAAAELTKRETVTLPAAVQWIAQLWSRRGRGQVSANPRPAPLLTPLPAAAQGLVTAHRISAAPRASW